jgi:hypothetical protein
MSDNDFLSHYKLLDRSPSRRERFYPLYKPMWILGIIQSLYGKISEN